MLLLFLFQAAQVSRPCFDQDRESERDSIISKREQKLPEHGFLFSATLFDEEDDGKHCKNHDGDHDADAEQNAEQRACVDEFKNGIGIHDIKKNGMHDEPPK